MAHRRHPDLWRAGRPVMVEDMPAWLRIAGVAFAVLLIPGIVVGERIYTRIEKEWRNRVRWFR
jgi:hypothetical protein